MQSNDLSGASKEPMRGAPEKRSQLSSPTRIGRNHHQLHWDHSGQSSSESSDVGSRRHYTWPVKGGDVMGWKQKGEINHTLASPTIGFQVHTREGKFIYFKSLGF